MAGASSTNAKEFTRFGFLILTDSEVRAVMVSYANKGTLPPRIHGLAKFASKPFEFTQKETHFDSVWIRVRKGLKYLDEMTLKYGALKQVYVFMGTPWSQSLSRTITTSLRSSSPITHAFLREILKEDVTATLEEDVVFARKANVEVEAFEHEILKAYIDGDERYSLVGSLANELKLETYMSFTSVRILEKIRGYSADIIEGVPVVFHSLTHALLSGMRDITKMYPHMGLVDIGAYGSKFMVVHKGVARFTHHLPFGFRHFVSELAEKLSVSYGRASSIWDHYAEGTLEEKESVRVGVLIRKILRPFRAELHKAYSMYSMDYVFPPQLYVSTPHEMADFFLSYFKADSYQHYASPGETVAVSGLHPATIGGYTYHIGGPKVRHVDKFVLLFLERIVGVPE